MAIAGREFWKGFTLGAGTGVGIASLADPERGRRRRAMLRDRFVHTAHRAGRFARVASVDARHRVQGISARVQSLGRKREIDDDVLLARVRTRLGRVVSHPHAIFATVRNGVVELDGDLLASEHPALIAAISGMRGVKQVKEDMLRQRKHAGDVPALQGGVVRRRRHIGIARVSWTPTTRVVAGASALGLLALGRCLRGASGTALAIAGAGLGLRAATDLEMRRLLGFGGRRGIDIHKNLYVDAPPETVYRFWRNLEGFPRFMPHVHEVVDLGGGRSRWTISGPVGAPIRWTAEITRDVPGEVLAWESVTGSVLRHAGIVKFKRANGGTEVEVQMSYNPPGGVITHALASAFGADPKHDLDRDLLFMKSLIEHGKTTAHGRTVLREEIAPAHGSVEGELRKT